MIAINTIVEIKIPIQTSNLFKILNNKNNGRLANTQNRIVAGNKDLDNALSINDSKGIEEY